MRKLLIFISMMPFLWVQAQQSIRLDSLLNLSERNYPKLKEMGLITEKSTLALQNLETNWYPQLSLNAQATYQSEVTSLPISIPNMSIPTLDKDQYKINLEISQLIYDGGSLRYGRVMQQAGEDAEQKAVEVSLFELRQRVKELVLQILMLENSKELIEENINSLEASIEEINAGISNGAVLQSTGDNLMAAKIKSTQFLNEADFNQKALLDMLEIYSGLQIKPTDLILPTVEIDLGNDFSMRPEYRLLSSKQTEVEASQNLIALQNKPKLLGFGQAGYGRPGLNFLDNEFSAYYMVGVKLAWKPWNWNNVKREQQQNTIRKSIIEEEKNSLSKELSTRLAQLQNEILKYQSLIQSDEEIIRLKGNVVKTAKAQLSNGIITSSEYIKQLNEETQARINAENHKIQLINTKINYLFTQGKY